MTRKLRTLKASSVIHIPLDGYLPLGRLCGAALQTGGGSGGKALTGTKNDLPRRHEKAELQLDFLRVFVSSW
jgi:hypothetical protein